MKKNRVVSLDVVRIFSCICVLVVHFNAQVSGWNGTFVYPNSITPNYFLENRLYLGAIGVSLFFILSGATLMMTYREGALIKYYQKRFLNIFPMFWLAYCITTAVDFFLYKGLPSGDLKVLVFSFLGMDGYLSAMGLVYTNFYKVGEWFLGCLLCLYLIFPLIRWSLEKSLWLTLAWSMVIYIGAPRMLAYVGYTCNGQEFFLKIPEILVGMLLIKYRLVEKPKRLLCIFGTAGILAIILRNSIQNATLCTAVCMALFSVLVFVGESVKNEKVKKIIVDVANLTYPIFLIHHWLILRLLRGFDLAAIARRSVCFLFLIYVPLTLLLAYLLNKNTSRLVKRVSQFFEIVRK